MQGVDCLSASEVTSSNGDEVTSVVVYEWIRSISYLMLPVEGKKSIIFRINYEGRLISAKQHWSNGFACYNTNKIISDMKDSINCWSAVQKWLKPSLNLLVTNVAFPLRRDVQLYSPLVLFHQRLQHFKHSHYQSISFLSCFSLLLLFETLILYTKYIKKSWENYVRKLKNAAFQGEIKIQKGNKSHPLFPLYLLSYLYLVKWW